MRYLPLLFLLLFIAPSIYGQGAAPIHDHKKVRINKISIEGNKVTHTGIILRELNVHEGDSVYTDSLASLIFRNRQRIYNIQLFNEVEQTIDTVASGINWHIRVKERWFIIPTVTVQFADRNFNTWWVKQDHDLRRAMVGLTVTDKNFRGNLETLAVTVQAGYTQKLGISYIRPYINHDQTKGIGFSLSYAQSTQTYYNTDSNKLVYVGTYTGSPNLRQFEGGISYIYRPAYASRHTVQLNYKNYEISDTIVKLNPDYYSDKSNVARFIELFYRYEYNGVDNWSYSLRGFKLVTQAVIRKGAEGLKFQSYINVEAGLFKSIGTKWYYSFVLRGRLQYLQDQPYYFRGGLGTQTDYVRGYEYFIVDGDNYGVLRFDLKREIFNRTYHMPVKYFTAIPIRIYPKIFFDFGGINSPDPGNSYLSDRSLYSAGIGLDIVTLYDVKVRLEFAYNHLQQNGLYLHFNSE